MKDRSAALSANGNGNTALNMKVHEYDVRMKYVHL